jgi:hypothetical protein
MQAIKQGLVPNKSGRFKSPLLPPAAALEKEGNMSRESKAIRANPNEDNFQNSPSSAILRRAYIMVRTEQVNQKR